MSELLLQLKNITKSFGDTTVLHDFSLDVAKGEFLTLLGPSGCGKTTTIRIIAGLEAADSGQVLLRGTDISALPPERRGIHTVFQNYSLFPHMNVYKNVTYALKIQGVPKEEQRKRAEEMLRMVGMEGFERRRPSELSGGQKQRIAIARSLIARPEILLLDEPLGALDLQLRRRMQQELKEIQKKVGITFIYITHDQEEAMNLSDRIVILNEGRIVQEDTPDEIFHHPVNRFAASFIGESTLLSAVVRQKCQENQETDTPVSLCENIAADFQTAAGSFTAVPDRPVEYGSRVLLCLRPDDLEFHPEKPGIDTVCGRITEQNFSGGVLKTVILLDSGDTVSSSFRWDGPVCPGTRVGLSIVSKQVAVVPFEDSSDRPAPPAGV